MLQLVLDLHLREDATFENFVGEKNQVLIEYLQNPKESFIFLSGNIHSGLTHLLQALCHQHQHCLFLPLKHHAKFTPAILENSAQLELVAIDDIDAIAGNTPWEEAIFHLYNQKPDKLVISSHISPSLLDIQLPDLKSRLQAMLLLNTTPLYDEEKMSLLQQRAKSAGLNLSEEVGQYLLTHTSRDIDDLIKLFRELDKLSLQEKRRLTIPLVKKVLE